MIQSKDESWVKSSVGQQARNWPGDEALGTRASRALILRAVQCWPTQNPGCLVFPGLSFEFRLRAVSLGTQPGVSRSNEKGSGEKLNAQWGCQYKAYQHLLFTSNGPAWKMPWREVGKGRGLAVGCTSPVLSFCSRPVSKLAAPRVGLHSPARLGGPNRPDPLPPLSFTSQSHSITLVLFPSSVPTSWFYICCLLCMETDPGSAHGARLTRPHPNITPRVVFTVLTPDESRAHPSPTPWHQPAWFSPGHFHNPKSSCSSVCGQLCMVKASSITWAPCSQDSAITAPKSAWQTNTNTIWYHLYVESKITITDKFI